MSDYYSSPIGITSQFRFCGNSFRIDLYKGCSFGCRYCFINNRHKNNPRVGDRNKLIKPARKSQVVNLFESVFEDGKENNLNRELIARKTPLHCGGNSDPFQPVEEKHKLTLDFIKLSNRYNYPVMFCTKAGELNDQHWGKLNPEIHAFQISMMSIDPEFNKIYEANTETWGRLKLIKDLHNAGFWVGLRIQPLIDIDEALKLINYIKEYIDFITVEHIKLQSDNKKAIDRMKLILPYSEDDWKRQGNSISLNHDLKLANMEKIKNSTNIKVGFGDNDLHELSDSLNCCGIDTINENFGNWLKYNAMTLSLGVNEPTGLKSKMEVFPYIRKDFLHTYDDYVKYYYENIYKPFKVNGQPGLFD